jgi:hypothetical protein
MMTATVVVAQAWWLVHASRPAPNRPPACSTPSACWESGGVGARFRALAFVSGARASTASSRQVSVGPSWGAGAAVALRRCAPGIGASTPRSSADEISQTR